MQLIYRNCLISFLLILLPAIAFARSYKDADAVVTIKNGRPCFSYPKEDANQQRLYVLSFMDVTSAVDGKSGWLTNRDFENKGITVSPNSPETCIEYGVLSAGIKEKNEATKLLHNVPYRVFMQVAVYPGYERRYSTEFCLTSAENSEFAIVGAAYDKGWYCLKPGETGKRGFWESLFGK